MTKSLESAYRLASEEHPLEFYKEILRKHQEEALLEQQMRIEAEQKAREAKEAKEAAKAQATPAKKSKKKAKANDEEDVEMADADAEEGSELATKSKKRKADDTAEVGSPISGTAFTAGTDVLQTPQRTESVKKPKIKLTTSSTPKTANGTASATKAKEEPKSAKAKSKKSSKETADKAEKEVATPKEPEYTAEEKHQRKEVI